MTLTGYRVFRVYNARHINRTAQLRLGSFVTDYHAIYRPKRRHELGA